MRSHGWLWLWTPLILTGEWLAREILLDVLKNGSGLIIIFFSGSIPVPPENWYDVHPLAKASV